MALWGHGRPSERAPAAAWADSGSAFGAGKRSARSKRAQRAGRGSWAAFVAVAAASLPLCGCENDNVPANVAIYYSDALEKGDAAAALAYVDVKDAAGAGGDKTAAVDSALAKKKADARRCGAAVSSKSLNSEFQSSAALKTAYVTLSVQRASCETIERHKLVKTREGWRVFF